MSPSGQKFLDGLLRGETLGNDLLARIGDRFPELCARIRESIALSAQIRAQVETIEIMREAHEDTTQAMREMNATFALHVHMTHLIEAETARAIGGLLS